MSRPFTTSKCRRRAASFPADKSMRFADDAYLDHETWIRPAFARRAGSTAGAALDYGCGHGMAAVVMARRGAGVTAFDLSPAYVDGGAAAGVGQRRGRRFAPSRRRAAAVADGSFDRSGATPCCTTWTSARAVRECAASWRPGGVAVFCEPWGENPLLTWAQRRLHYAGKGTRPTRSRCACGTCRPLREVFPPLRPSRAVSCFRWCGAWCGRDGSPPPSNGATPGCCGRPAALGWFCRYVVLTLPR